MIDYDPNWNFDPSDDIIEITSDDEVGYCTSCNGSGEGRYDGSTCTNCKGLGESK